jgi:hypothetical protein
LVFSANGWDGWTTDVSRSVIISDGWKGFGWSATVPTPFRDRKVGGSNPLAPTQ